MSTVDPATCTIDDLGPLPVVQPSSAAEVGDIVRRAAADNQAIYPLGGRTMLHLGLPPTKPGIGVDLRRLNQVIDYPARDMTITVQAGITIAKLQEILRTENQQLPVDVPLPDQATLGGALAVNSSGPRRYGYGTLRDYVIGITTVNDEGQETKAGGRVVKNVAGYDLCKLHIGALGTLGVITQVTLKLRPVAEATALVALGCPPLVLAQILDLLHGARIRPVAIDLINANAVRAVRQLGKIELPERQWVVLVGFDGSQEVVRWQVEQLRRELDSAIVHGDVEWQSTHETQRVLDTSGEVCTSGRMVIKANLLPKSIAEFCRQVSSLSEDPMLKAHAGSGIARVRIDTEMTVERAQSLLQTLQAVAAEAQGNVVVLRCPTAWKKLLPIWGAPRGDAWLMRAVKDRLDPRRVFNPGRFVEGI